MEPSTESGLRFQLTQTIIVIPVAIHGGIDDFPPLRRIEGKPVIDCTYATANAMKAGDTIFATPHRFVASYCGERRYHWRPVSDTFDNDTDRVKDVIRQSRRTTSVETVIYWPWFRPFLPKALIRSLLREQKAVWASDTEGIPLLGIYPVDALRSDEVKCSLLKVVYEYERPPALTPSDLAKLAQYVKDRDDARVDSEETP